MSSREKRIAIAKDVIKRIKLGKLRVAHQGYFDRNKEFPIYGSLQKQIEKAEANCRVCAMGGMLLSYARLYNEVRCESLVPAGLNLFEHIASQLKGVFTNRTLAIIEGVFEGEVYNEEAISPEWKSSVEKKAIILRINKKIEDYRETVNAKYNKTKKGKMTRSAFVLLKICENIIRNDGKFSFVETPKAVKT